MPFCLHTSKIVWEVLANISLPFRIILVIAIYIPPRIILSQGKKPYSSYADAEHAQIRQTLQP
jgi:hypothetical protein